MKSQKLQITSVSTYPARDDSHYKGGYDLRLDMSFPNQRDCLIMAEFLRSDKVWVTDKEPKD